MQLVVISVFYCLFYIVTAQSDSSCTPHIFSYKTDDPNTVYYPYLYGIISTPLPSNVQGLWNLKVEISIGNSIGETNGSIKLTTPPSLAAESIQQNKPLEFEVRFPYWINIKPKITKIAVNENIICVGEPIEEDLAPNRVNYVFTLTLQNSNSSTENFYRTTTPLVTETPNYDWYFPTTSTTQSVRSTYYPPRPYPSSGSCGVMSAKPTISLIVGGVINPEGANPWLAALFNKKNGKPNFICGSNLISERHLITAAHCVSGVRDIRIFSLALGRSNIEDWSIGEVRKLKDIHVHHDYISDQPDADLAILVMSQEVQFSSTIAPICLLNNNINFQQTVGTLGVVAGWGRDESDQQFTAQSKQITLPIVSEEACLASDVNFRTIISKRTFCAGSRENMGPCTGDSGGGFYVEGAEKKWYIKGIVSVALRKDNTCDLGNYLVFVDLAQYSEWIISNIT